MVSYPREGPCLLFLQVMSAGEGLGFLFHRKTGLILVILACKDVAVTQRVR